LLKVPASEIANRLAAFQSLLARQEVDVALIRQNTDLYYFTGTVQDAHLIVPALGQPLLLVKRDVQRTEEQSPIRPIVPLDSLKELPDAVLENCVDYSPKRLGMELDVLPASTFFFYDENLFPNHQIVDISGLIRQIRMVKSPWEIEMMRGAAAISQAVADAVPQVLRKGMSELELMAELEAVARKAGHLGFSRVRTFNMEVYVAHVLSGPEAATSSYIDSPTGGLGLSPAFGQGPSRRRIKAGEIVSVDILTNHNGYLNDQTRNYSMGQPSARLREAHELSREIHARFREKAKPGSVTGELYQWIWEMVEGKGWADHFMGHGQTRVSFIGHGLGLEVDEFPFIAKEQKLSFREGMTLAFEPKFIIPGQGIAGLENTYLVVSNGLESLNTATEDLVIL
jgi:Xaa-Pro aminopeptidase